MAGKPSLHDEGVGYEGAGYVFGNAVHYGVICVMTSHLPRESVVNDMHVLLS